jgi:hypothetical protein
LLFTHNFIDDEINAESIGIPRVRGPRGAELKPEILPPGYDLVGVGVTNVRGALSFVVVN